VKTSRTCALALASLAAAFGVGTGCASKSSGTATLASSDPAFEGADAVDAVDQFIAAHPVDTSQPNWKTRVSRPPAVAFPEGRSYEWILTTSEGMIRIRLLPEAAPHHVASTIYLTRLGFYDGLTFHRVIPGFMAQGGDPLGNGTGGPGYRYSGEISKKLKHDKKGIVSMANSGPRSDGSQFFITFKEAQQLDGKHTIFGEVIEGTGTLRTIEQLGTKEGPPRKKIEILRSEIRVR